MCAPSELNHQTDASVCVCVCVWPLHEQIQQLLRFTERPVRGEKRSDEIGIWKTRENVFFNKKV